MLIQVGLVSKALVAFLVGAFVWLVSLVEVLMCLKTSLLCEPSIADFTFKRFDTIVGPQVNLKSLNFRIRFIAARVCALELFFDVVS